MKTKTEKAIKLFEEGKLKESLKIFKDFNLLFNKDQKAILKRTYEMYDNSKFYMQLGFNFEDQLNKSLNIIKLVYGDRIKINAN